MFAPSSLSVSPHTKLQFTLLLYALEPSLLGFHRDLGYRKITKISPSKYNSQTLNAKKKKPLNRPSKYKPPGGLYLEIALNYKVKQSKNGKFPSNYKASPIDFETQIFLHR